MEGDSSEMDIKVDHTAYTDLQSYRAAVVHINLSDS